MGQTVSEKIISKAAGLTEVKPGDVVTCSVDLAMIHDSGGPRRVKQIMAVSYTHLTLPTTPYV